MSYSSYMQLLYVSGKQVNDLNISEYALRKSDALQAISLLEDTNIVILGGEVYELMDDGYFQPLHDNWYCNISEFPSSELPMRSQRRAYEYIQKYPEGEKKSIWYEITIDSANRARLPINWT